MGIKLVTRLRLGLSHLTEHKFKHSFQDTLNHLCNCKIDVESFTHLLLKCHSYINERWPSWATWKELTHKYFKHLCNFWQTHFFGGNSSYSDKRYYWLHPINKKVWWTTFLNNAFLVFSHLQFWQIYQFLRLQIPA